MLQYLCHLILSEQMFRQIKGKLGKKTDKLKVNLKNHIFTNFPKTTY